MSTPTRFSPCILIPHYNHADAFESVMADLAPYNIPIIVVEDGSSPIDRQKVASVGERHTGTIVVQHEVNRGKGAAVISGIRAAARAGYTHAVQIDADGQHQLSDTPRLIEAAAAAPETLILGTPIFGADAPWERIYFRKIAAFFVWLETGSCSVDDSMCGFRVYPVEKTAHVVNTFTLDERMGFDTEVIVRLMWQGVAVRNMPIQVNYPRDGISHYRYWQDNITLIRVHAGLVFTALGLCGKKR